MDLRIEIPVRVVDFAEMCVTQAEKTFDAFFEAANKAATVWPKPTAQISKKALSLTEQNMRTAVNHARMLIHAKDVHEAVRLQAEFLRNQVAVVTEQFDASLAARDTPTG